jgi:hypothetical protein
MSREGEGRAKGERSGNASEPAPAALPKVAMLFSADSWTFNVRLGRGGREESEGIIVIGEVSYRSGKGERQHHPARAMIVKADPRKKLEITLSAQETVLTIPLEPSAMQRMQERLKDLVSFYGMRLRVAFSAAEISERQPIEVVDVAFSSGEPRSANRPRAGQGS